MNKNLGIYILSKFNKGDFMENQIPNIDQTIEITATPVKVTLLPGRTTLQTEGMELPKGVKLEIKKSFIKITGGTKTICLKGKLMEFNTVIKEMDPRLIILTPEIIKAKHLGTMKAILKGVADVKDLQEILVKYFI